MIIILLIAFAILVAAYVLAYIAMWLVTRKH